MQILRTQTAKHLVSTIKMSESLDDRLFEVMVFCDKINDEIECFRFNIRSEAEKKHFDLVKKYSKNKVSENLGNLLIAANNEAQKFDHIEDGGTCNFDGVVLNLKGKRSNFIHEIIAFSGLHLSKLEGKYWSGGYMVNFDLKGQANKRTKMAEAAYKFLKENNVLCNMYYQAD